MATAVESENREHYIADIEASQAVDAPAWLREIRAAAAAEFAKTPFPNHKQEAWRYTDVRPVLRAAFRMQAEPGATDATLVQTHLYDETAWTQLVFVDGAYSPDLSRTAALPDGVIAGSLAEAIEQEHPAAKQYLNRVVEASNTFISLNAALVQDGLFVYVPKGVKAETPIHVLHIATGADGAAAYPRSLIVLEESAEADVIETFAGPDTDACYFNNVVSEAVIGDNAELRRHKIVEEGPAAYHLSAACARLGRDARFKSFAITLGGHIVRNELQVVLAGQGGHCDLNGLYLNDRDRLIDNPLHVEHVASNCYSRMAYKGVLDGTSRSVFTGKVFVEPGAQRTDSDQINNNLLKSDDATIDTKPQLEIFADDVKCTHGATIGGFPREVLFYFQSRGMSRAMADAILTYGFASEIVDAIEVGPLHDRLDTYVFDKFRPR
jgi:Fe-S cluster assembly protein SufD